MVKVAINGFGRMGRLALREAYDWPDVAFVHINETATDAEGSAHLLHFDSAHGAGGMTPKRRTAAFGWRNR